MQSSWQSRIPITDGKYGIPLHWWPEDSPSQNLQWTLGHLRAVGLSSGSGCQSLFTGVTWLTLDEAGALPHVAKAVFGLLTFRVSPAASQHFSVVLYHFCVFPRLPLSLFATESALPCTHSPQLGRMDAVSSFPSYLEVCCFYLWLPEWVTGELLHLWS